MTVQWDSHYGDMLPAADDGDGMIPLIGVRMLIGVTNQGVDQFIYVVDNDGNQDAAKTLHMLRIVTRIIENQSMAQYDILMGASAQTAGAGDDD